MADDEIKVVGVASSSGGGKPNGKVIIAIIGVVVLALGVIAGILLVRQQQDIREKAAATDDQCPAAQQCPDTKNPKVLKSCDVVESDGTPDDKLCSGIYVKKREICGTRYYCCPAEGASWTTNLSLCPEGSPTGSVTASPTATATATATSTSGGTTRTTTPTATSTTRSSTTPRATTAATTVPVPVTGTNWPSIVGMGAGAIVIFVSLLFAL